MGGSCAATPSGPRMTVATSLPCTLCSVGCWYSCLSVPALAQSIPAITGIRTILALLISCLSLLPLLCSLRSSPGTAHPGGRRTNSPPAIRRAQIPPMPCAFPWMPCSLTSFSPDHGHALLVWTIPVDDVEQVPWPGW